MKAMVFGWSVRHSSPFPVLSSCSWDRLTYFWRRLQFQFEFVWWQWRWQWWQQLAVQRHTGDCMFARRWFQEFLPWFEPFSWPHSRMLAWGCCPHKHLEFWRVTVCPWFWPACLWGWFEEVAKCGVALEMAIGWSSFGSSDFATERAKSKAPLYSVILLV